MNRYFLFLLLVLMTVFLAGCGGGSVGSIHITSLPPGAEILLDGRNVGVTPALIEGLSPGSHMIFLTYSDCDVWQQSVNVSANQTTEVNASLTTSMDGVHGLRGIVDLAVNETTGYVYVASQSENAIYVYDYRLRFIKAISVNQPVVLAVNPVTNEVWCACYPSSISIIDGITNEVIDTIPHTVDWAGVTVKPQLLVVDYNLNRFFLQCVPITLYNPKFLVVYSGADRSMLTVVVVNGGAEGLNGMAVNSDTHKIYITDNRDGGIIVIDGSVCERGYHIDWDSFENELSYGICVNQRTNTVYAGARHPGEIVVIDGNNDSVISRVCVGSGSGMTAPELAADPTTDFIFAAVYKTVLPEVPGFICFNGQTNTIKQIYHWGGEPYLVAVNSSMNIVYYVGWDSYDGTVMISRLVGVRYLNY